MLVLLLLSSVPAGAEMAEPGVLDLREAEFVESADPISLRGPWRFHWKRFLEPSGAFLTEVASAGEPLSVPGRWGLGDKPSAGYGTYALRILLPGSAPERLALRMPDVYSTYCLWIDGKQHVCIGTPGSTAAESQPARGERRIAFRRASDEVHLLMHVSNFFNRDGGILMTPQLGTPEQIDSTWVRDVTGKALLSGVALVLALTQLVVFLLRRDERAYLYAALWMALIPLPSIWSSTGVLAVFFPDLPLLELQTNDSLFVMAGFVFFGWYLRELFPREMPRFLPQSFVALLILQLIVSLSLSGVERVQTMVVFVIVGQVLLLTPIPRLVLALRNGRDGAAAALIAYFLLSLLTLAHAGVRVFSGEKLDLLAFSAVLFAGVHAFLLAQRYTRSYQRIERLEKSLRRANRLKDEFLANTSHELRTPLHGMIGIAESVAATSGTTGPVRHSLHLIIASGRRLARLIDDILDFTRLRHDDLSVPLGPVRVDGLVSLVLETCRVLVGNRPLELVSQIPADLPPVRGNANRLQQVLFNLVGNAVKFTESGTVTVSAERIGDAVRISVSDTGIGMSEAELARVFEPYEQVIDDSATGRGGAGLGLTITRDLVRIHGSELQVESRPGQGTTFHFLLPVASGAAETQPEPPSIMAGAEAPPDPPMPRPRLDPEAGTILVVDDDAVGRQVLEQQLTLAGYTTLTASSGPEALEVIERTPPDLVILDVMMPGMSGYEVCRAIRESFDPNSMPVLMLTARTRDQDVVIGLRAGANDYLGKPFAREELLARVEAQLTIRDNEQLRWEIACREAERKHPGGPADFRELLVETLRASVLCWERATGLSRVELARKSGIWTVTLDGSVSKARTLDRYLSPETLPKRPRWSNVVKTAGFVMETCGDNALADQVRALVKELEEQLKAGVQLPGKEAQDEPVQTGAVL